MASKSESDSGSKRKGPRAATPASQVRDRVRLEPGAAPAPRRKAVVLPKPDRVRTRWGEPALDQALIFFYRGLHTMMNAGLPVTKSLEMLAAQCERRDLGDSLKAVSRAVERGQYLSEALRAHPYIFPKLHPALVRVGERTGSLLHVLDRLSQSMEREQAVPNRNFSAFREKSTQKLAVPLVLTLEGHEDFRVTANDDLLYGRWPQDGTITLRPKNWKVAGWDGLLRYWPPLLAVLLAAVVALLQIRRRRAVQRQNLELAGLQHEGDPLLDSLVGQYRILSMLGAGGMAVVYLARRGDEAGADVVALKVVAPQMAADPEFTARFRREVQAYMKLDHRNIVRLMDCGMQPPYLVMELVDGVTLREAMKAGPLAYMRAVDWLSHAN